MRYKLFKGLDQGYAGRENDICTKILSFTLHILIHLICAATLWDNLFTHNGSEAYKVLMAV